MRKLFKNNSIIRNAIILLLFFIIVLALYFPVLMADPLWDDWFFLFRSRTILEGSILKYWVWGEHRRAWPAFYSAMTLMYKFFGNDYFSYRLVNIFFHAINGYLIYKAIKLLKGHYALILSLIYLVHPLNFFTVSWIIQFKTLLSIFFFLISLIYFIKNEESFSYGKYLVSIGMFALSLLAKSVFAPIALLSVFYSRKKRVLPYLIICLYSAGLTVWSTHIAPAIKTTDFLSPFIQTAVAVENDNVEKRRSRPMAAASNKESGYIFEDAVLAFKNFARYSSFVVFPSKTLLVQKPTEVKYTVEDYLLVLVTVFGTLFLIKKSVDSKRPVLLMGVLFYIITILPLCGFFFVPIFHYSNFVDYWLSVPVLGILLIISQLEYRKWIHLLLGLFFLVCLFRTCYIAFENKDPVTVITNSSNENPDKSLIKLILAKHYFYSEQFSKSNAILINVKKNYNLDSKNIEKDIDTNMKAMQGAEIDNFSL